jgi:hypothetical protein
VSGTHFSHSLFDYSLDSFGFVDVGRPLWREDESVLFSFCRASPAQPFSDLSPTGLMRTVNCPPPQPGGPGSCIAQDQVWVVELSLSYGRRSVDQFVLVSGSPLELITRFYAYPFFSDNCFVVLPVGRPLWREDGSVTYSAIADWSGQRTNNHTLPSHLRLCSLFVASYDSQGLLWR